MSLRTLLEVAIEVGVEATPQGQELRDRARQGAELVVDMARTIDRAHARVLERRARRARRELERGEKPCPK